MYHDTLNTSHQGTPQHYTAKVAPHTCRNVKCQNIPQESVPYKEVYPYHRGSLEERVYCI